MRWSSGATKRNCQTISKTEARERFLLCNMRLKRAYFQDEGGIENEQVEGNIGGQWRVKRLSELVSYVRVGE